MALLATKEYTGTGSQTDFLYDFDYFEEAHIHGYVNEVEVSISFADPTTVRFATPPADTSAIRIRRETPTGAAYYTYPDPAYLKSSSLNNNQTQALHLAEELIDKNDTLPEDIATVNTLAAQVTIDAAATAADVVQTTANAEDTAADKTDAETAASTATTKASEASTSATTASDAADETAILYDNFDDRYLGAKASEPTLDNDGEALIEGAMYFNSTSNDMWVYNSSTWGLIGTTQNSAASINVTDTANRFTGTNAEDILAEVGESLLGTNSNNTVSGTAANIVLTFNNPIQPNATAPETGLIVTFIPTADSTTQATLKVDSSTAKQLNRMDYNGNGVNPIIQAGRIVVAMFDGTAYQVLNPFNDKPFSCTLYGSANEAITTTTPETLTWDSIDHQDLAPMYSGSTPSRLIVPPNTSKVRLTAMIVWANNATGYRKVEIVPSSGVDVGGTITQNAVDGEKTIMSCTSSVVECEPDDYFEVSVTQNSGSNLDVEMGTALQTAFSMEVID